MNLLCEVGTVLWLVTGAFLLVCIKHCFVQAGAWVTIDQGSIFVACVLAFGRDIAGESREWWQNRERKRQDAGVDPNRSG